MTNTLSSPNPGALAAPGQRVVVIGNTGSGKTTLARRLGERLGIAHVELDALHWGANWTPAPLEVFRERVSQALAGDSWVVDGSYSKVRDLIWPHAQTIIWLDYALPLILWRLTKRTISRIGRRTELWNGNRETLRSQLFSRDSLYLWALQSHRRKRRDYSLALAQPEHAHLRLIHLRSTRAAARWLAEIPVR
jgi:adenylate kinase family enzyme